MTLEQLRIFVAVAERQHVTRAAEALHLAQSAASAAIAALEVQHETRLFHRVGRGIELTEAGRIFLDEARAVLARAAGAELALAELAGLRRGMLALAASQTIASYWLPRHLAAFRRAYPAIAVRLTIGNTTQVAAAVRVGTVEIGFIEGRIDDAALTSATLTRDRMLVVVAPDHPWASNKILTPDDLRAAEWVLREPGSGTRSAFEQALGDVGISGDELRVAIELPSNESVRAAVESGLGATAISASVVASSIEAGLLIPVPFALPDREFQAIVHAERYKSRAADTLLEVITQAVPSRGPTAVSVEKPAAA
jgi:DNA-binding transcriptional LysR family regulator